MKTLTASLYCPAMKVTRVDAHTYVTAVEPMTLAVEDGGGFRLVMPNVVIAATEVRRQHVWHWLVDACVGTGIDGASNAFAVHLPAEDVIFDIFLMCMVAKAITAPARLELSDGTVFTGDMHFPDCRTDLLTGIAEPVTATGTLTLQN